MNFLFDNPIANMQGSIFLIFYGVLISITALTFYLSKSKLDWTANQPIPLVPQNPDPYQVAYLRGGENELIRTLIFSLTQKGFLLLTNYDNTSYISLAQNQPNWTTLTELERSILGYFQTSRETKEVFSGLSNVIAPFATQYEQQMVNNHLVTPKEVIYKVRVFSFIAFGIVALIGGYKFLAAVMQGRSNVIFLVIFTIVAFIIFMILGKTKRLSQKGEKFVEAIQNAFDKLRYNQKIQANSTTFNSFDPTLLAMGIFGTSVLIGSQYNDFEQAFQRSSVSGGSSCGSACGSSSCSSGSDGGGGGCGGCGGGCS
ncbi:MAG: TIGR04222 domain-containing membrane protein [Pyrinomonadaceae bacterium]|nr:TIGR04222 domain-containing membrane protein [Pyrinomonadaceae bacterium]